jgi:hypothetical protein
MAQRVLGRIRSRKGEAAEKVHSISARLTDEERDMLDALCARYKWNLSQMVSAIIRHCFNNRVNLNPDTDEDKLPTTRRR